MNHPAPKKNCSALGTLPKVLWLIMAFAVLKLPLAGQETIDYRGVWQAETPDNGKLILIVKRNNLASYFWADNADRTIYQGTWSSDADGTTLKWKDGSSHRIAPTPLGYEITHSNAAQQTLYKTAADKLPEEILGQWAKEPSRPEDELSDRNRAEGFFGAWQIGDEPNSYYLVIEPDRSAATNWTEENLSKPGLRGSWAKQGSELHIPWDAGYYGILKQKGSNFVFRLIEAGKIIEEDESNELIATRISEDLLPVEWKTAYTDEKQTRTGGVAFTDRKDANSFYRGSWIIQRSEDTFERIEIGRFGGLKTSADSTLYGNWRMSGQDIFMSWDDGMRKILSPVGNGFLLYEYKPGRPIDGVPTRIFPATPEDSRKLAEHMEDRKAVAMRLLSLAEDAGITTKITDTGWGQTFMRWAWPFGDQSKENPYSDALFQADLESSESIDPWWWPFWSETHGAEITEPDKERNKVEIVMDSGSSETNTNETVSNQETAKPTKSGWEWPF